MVNESKRDAIYLGNEALDDTPKPVYGNVVEFDGQAYYRIENFDQMTPFFMSVVSDSDVWMFISSTGALSAGRRNPDNALFPYYNDDRIHDSYNTTGGKTLVLATINNKTHLWEPFAGPIGPYKTKRNMYKRPLGNDIIFEEINLDLGLSFIYKWTSCDRLGLIRQSRIINHNKTAVNIKLLDGIQNVLPAGVDRNTQLGYSTLLDGYKKNELLPEHNIGIYSLSSLLTDRAEPAESLRSTVVWSAGIKPDAILLSSLQLDAFRRGVTPKQELDIRARRGAYFIYVSFDLKNQKEWSIIADLKIDACGLSDISSLIEKTPDLNALIKEELLKGDNALAMILARGDAQQLGNDALNIFRHGSVSLFNIMRGGIFEDNYRIQKNDLIKFIRNSNTSIFNMYKEELEDLPSDFYYNELPEFIRGKDANLERLCYEYLPLSFSRRHGDPSRPWNDFSIDIRDENGDRTLNYQGNWRDVFQNWEALALSFPEYLEGMIAKFVNSTTADGYNPYRLTRDGFDWEAPEPDVPFANIGYWGDHQIVYLLKLLKLSSKYHPGKLEGLLTREVYSYANVPYVIRSYRDTLKDPHHTIDFNHDLHKAIMEKMKSMGTDAQRLQLGDEPYLVNLTEKLLVPVLSKLSNFVPGAGIWMNTQRPEWNDANNALVGHGVSMVTLYYMRDHIEFLSRIFGNLKQEKIPVSEEIDKLFSDIFKVLLENRGLLGSMISDVDRKAVLDALGESGSAYRESLYRSGLSGVKIGLSKKDILGFLALALKYIDHTIKLNRRDDGLYHAYNVIRINDDAIAIRRLYEMLEGQVALLSSGYLSPEESVDVLRALRESKLYRADQRSYILYPDRRLPRFTDKNIIPSDLVHTSAVLKSALKKNDQKIILRSRDGHLHFHPDFSNAALLKNALEKDTLLSEKERKAILDLYESVFDHQSFTGRSGTFYKYEGLGCIYWHMVSKLLLAVQDTFFRAYTTNAGVDTLETLKAFYYEIREGIGSHKSPAEYGAFPMDPYSHTPGYAGVQQPGMTGQTKEDLLARSGELGVRVKDGKIGYTSALLNDSEFLTSSRVFKYYDIENKQQTLMLGENMLAFTMCQVPIIYIKSDMDKIIVTLRDGSEQVLDGCTLPEPFSRQIFERNNRIIKIHVLMKLL